MPEADLKSRKALPRILVSSHHHVDALPHPLLPPDGISRSMSDEDPALVSLYHMLTLLGLPVLFRGRRALWPIFVVAVPGLLISIYRWNYEAYDLVLDANTVRHTSQATLLFRLLLAAFAFVWLFRQALRRPTLQSFVLSNWTRSRNYPHDDLDAHSAITRSATRELFHLLLPVGVLEGLLMAWFFAYRQLWIPPNPCTGEPFVHPTSRLVSLVLVWVATLYAQAIFLLPCVLFRINLALALGQIRVFLRTFLTLESHSPRKTTVPPHDHLTPDPRVTPSTSPYPMPAASTHSSTSTTTNTIRSSTGTFTSPTWDGGPTLDAHINLRKFLRSISHRYRYIFLFYLIFVGLEVLYVAFFMLESLVEHQWHAPGTSLGARLERFALFVLVLISPAFHAVGIWLDLRAATIVAHRIRDAVQDFAIYHAWAAVAGPSFANPFAGGVSRPGAGPRAFHRGRRAATGLGKEPGGKTHDPDPDQDPDQDHSTTRRSTYDRDRDRGRDVDEKGKLTITSHPVVSPHPVTNPHPLSNPPPPPPPHLHPDRDRDRDVDDEGKIYDRAVACRAAVLSYLVENTLGLTLFGFRLDRELLRSSHTAFISICAFLLTRVMLIFGPQDEA